MADPIWHFEANDIFFPDGDFLKRWTSKNYESPDLIQNINSKKPLFRENFRNGNDVVEFRSNYSHHMFTEELGDDRFDRQNSFTTIIVCKVDPSQDDHILQSWQYLNSDDYMWEQHVDSTNFTTIRKTESGNKKTSIVLERSISGWKIHISRHSPTEVQQFTNGVEGFKETGEFIDVYDHTETRLGARIGDEKNTLNGYVAEFMTFNEMVSLKELQKIQSELSDKYNISTKSIS